MTTPDIEAYLAKRAQERSDAVTKMISNLTPREYRLVREAAVMGWVQGDRHAKPTLPSEAGNNIPRDAEILHYVLDGCRAFSDLYPFINDLEDDDGIVAVVRASEPVGRGGYATVVRQNGAFHLRHVRDGDPEPAPEPEWLTTWAEWAESEQGQRREARRHADCTETYCAVDSDECPYHKETSDPAP